MQVEIRGVQNLSFRERQVVTLKEMGRSTEEIARQLGISASTVATLYHRARSKGYEVVIVLPGNILGIMEPLDSEEGLSDASSAPPDT